MCPGRWMRKLVRRAVAEHTRLCWDHSWIGRAVELIVQACSGIILLTFLRVVLAASVFCSSASADRIVMAASRLLGAAAVCARVLSFVSGHRKSYWSGCIKTAVVICQRILSILTLVIFL